MSKKSILLLIIIIVLIVLAAYFYFSRDEEKTSEETSVPKEKEEVVEQPTEETGKTANWKSYTNNKYNYTFKYPSDFEYGPCTKKPCSKFIYDKLEGKANKDYVLLQGDIRERGWPNVTVVHYDTDFYNPPKNTNLITWLAEESPYKEKVPDNWNLDIDNLTAIKIHVPSSPQTYSMDIIYCMKDNKIFEITMMDVDSKAAQDFYYNLFIPNFRFND